MYEYHYVNPWISWNPMDFYLNQLKNTDGTEHEIGWEWVHKPDIRSRPKNGSRAMKMNRSGNGFGPGSRNASKRPSGVSKNQYSIQTKKWLARNENESFWQWFWAMIQKCFKTAFWSIQKPNIRSRPKNGSRAMKMSRSGNGFEPGARHPSKGWFGKSKHVSKNYARIPPCFKNPYPNPPHASKTHTLIHPRSMLQKPIPWSRHAPKTHALISPRFKNAYPNPPLLQKSIP